MKKTGPTPRTAPAVFKPTLGGLGPAFPPNQRTSSATSPRKAVSTHGVMRGSKPTVTAPEEETAKTETESSSVETTKIETATEDPGPSS
jgi:hypothetical protein